MGASAKDWKRNHTMNFVVGTTYATRSICDSECIVSLKVVARTAKTITTEKGKTLRITTAHDGEYVKPWGSYSMCPIIRADDRA